MDNQPRTMNFGGKTVVLLVVGEENYRGQDHICGFVSNEASLPTAALDVIKDNFDKLDQMDLNGRLQWIKNLANTPVIKIPKSQIVDRRVKDGPEPIHMYNQRVLWK